LLAQVPFEEFIPKLSIRIKLADQFFEITQSLVAALQFVGVDGKQLSQ